MADEQPTPEVQRQARRIASGMTKAAVESEFFASVQAVQHRLSLWEAALAGMAGNIDDQGDAITCIHRDMEYLKQVVALVALKVGVELPEGDGGAEEGEADGD